MRLLGFLEYVIVIVGAIGMAAAHTYGLTKGVYLGLFLIGAGIALAGIESVVTRGMSFRFATIGVDHYAGIPAQIWGWMLLIIGGMVIASAYLMDAGQWRMTLNFFMRRPGGLLVLFGFVTLAIGALTVYSPHTRGTAWTLLVRLPTTLVGLVIVIAGVAAIGLGVWEAVDPASFRRITGELLAQARLLSFDYYWRRLLAPLL